MIFSAFCAHFNMTFFSGLCFLSATILGVYGQITDIQLYNKCPAERREPWSYKGLNGPPFWGLTYPNCYGYQQSPIAIRSENAVKDENLAKLTLNNYDQPMTRAKIENNGHTIEVVPEDGVSRTISVNGDEYSLQQFHFHWGDAYYRGSEHSLDDTRYAMEVKVREREGETAPKLLHKFMHQGAKVMIRVPANTRGPGPIPRNSSRYADDCYSIRFSYLPALHLKKMHFVHMNANNQIAVVGIFFQEQDDDNEELQKLVDEFPNVKYKGDESELQSNINLNNLLPANPTSFYRYQGSLTTPACSEGVTWSVVPDPIPVGRAQMKQFRQQLYSVERKDAKDTCKLVNNYRPLQLLFNRTVSVSQ